MSDLKPSVLQMLEIGKDCGLKLLSEAYDNYMNHYDCFFLISDFGNQLKMFQIDLFDHGLLTYYGRGFMLKELTIDKAIALYKSVEDALKEKNNKNDRSEKVGDSG